GEAQHAELAVLADLELREAGRLLARACRRRSKPPARQQAEREDLAVPGRKRKLRPGLLELQHEHVALAPQHGLAEGGTREAAGERRQCRERSRACRLGEQLLLRGELGLRSLERGRDMVDRGIIQEPVERPYPERNRQAHVRLVAENDQSDVAVGEEAEKRAE